MTIEPSHLIINVVETDRTLAFYEIVFGIEIESDHTFAQPALDSIYGVTGVTIRSVFFTAGGYRLHTVETVHPRNALPDPMGPAAGARVPGLNGLSFLVDDVEAFAARVDAAAIEREDIVVFAMTREEEMALFFMQDPDGVRLEFCQRRPRHRRGPTQIDPRGAEPHGDLH